MAKMTHCHPYQQQQQQQQHQQQPRPTSEGINNFEGLRSHGGENIVRKREARITKASIAITIMFVFCHTPRVIPNLFEVLGDPSTFPKVTTI
jgi:hypothetical protein